MTYYVSSVTLNPTHPLTSPKTSYSSQVENPRLSQNRPGTDLPADVRAAATGHVVHGTA